MRQVIGAYALLYREAKEGVNQRCTVWSKGLLLQVSG
jgi:hypothetical protein